MSLLRRFNRWRHERRLARAELRRRRTELFAAARVARWESEQRRRLVAAGLPAEVVNAPLVTPPAYDDPPTTQLDLSRMIPAPRRGDEQ